MNGVEVKGDGVVVVRVVEVGGASRCFVTDYIRTVSRSNQLLSLLSFETSVSCKVVTHLEYPQVPLSPQST